MPRQVFIYAILHARVPRLYSTCEYIQAYHNSQVGNVMQGIVMECHVMACHAMPCHVLYCNGMEYTQAYSILAGPPVISCARYGVA